MIFDKNTFSLIKPVSVIPEVDCKLVVVDGDGSRLLVEGLALPAGMALYLRYAGGASVPTAFVNLQPGALMNVFSPEEKVNEQ